MAITNEGSVIDIALMFFASSFLAEFFRQLLIGVVPDPLFRIFCEELLNCLTF
jgi:hypothetical protein